MAREPGGAVGRVRGRAVPAASARSGCLVDPFDVETANRELVPSGVVYGAGIGRFGKPQFFLGALEREEWRDGVRILVSRCEYARDLSPAPAAVRGSTIYVRLESLQRLLWEGPKHGSASAPTVRSPRRSTPTGSPTIPTRRCDRWRPSRRKR